MDNVEKKIIPKNAFDSEYFTEWLREVRFLSEKGIRYTFVRKSGEYSISQFKYKKTPALFAALVEFYAIVEAEKNVRKKNAVKPEIKEQLISSEELKKAQEVLEKALKQGVIKEGVDVTELQEVPVEVTVEKDDAV